MSTFTSSQREAIEARGNVLVSAGAGTGKTRTVVERCLRLILEDHCPLDRILMVTFTEAAAAEMRARLRKELERARDAEGGERKALLDEQLALLDTAHISTLHSFCLELIRQEFHQLGIDPQVNVLDEAQTVPLVHQTLDSLLERCYAGEWPMANHVRELVRRHGGSDEKLRELVLRVHRYTQTRPDPEGWFAAQEGKFNEAEPRAWRELLVQAFIEWREEWLPEIGAFAECSNVEACVRALEASPPNPSFTDVAQALECVNMADTQTKWEHGSKGRFRKPIEKFFDEASFLASLTRSRDDKDPLAEDWEWVRQPVSALLELSRAFTREFTAAKRAQGGVDFADLEQLALKLLRDEHGQPTATARQWQERFAHVFVDECQDINAAQDAIIRAVSRGDRPAEGEGRINDSSATGAGNRFLVGDVKQSIYRFRLAAPTIFRVYEQAWQHHHGGSRIALSDNFRSREGVLDFVNSLFAELMRESVGGIEYDADARLRFGAAEHRCALAHEPNVPRVELHVIHKATDAEPANGEFDANGDAAEPTGRPQAPEDLLAIEKEARLLASRLGELQRSKHQVWDEERKEMRDVAWRDMVVLLRSPSHRIETFAKEFSRAGVPLAVERAGFYTAIEVTDLLNVLRLLDNPLQDIPLAAVLRSPLVGLSLDELAAVRVGGNGEAGTRFFAAVNRVSLKGIGQAPEPFAGAAHAKLQKYFEQFARWRRLSRQTSLSHTLETILAETHYEALLLAGERGRERAANVRRFLELARQYDPYQRQGLFRFLRFVDAQQDAELDAGTAPVETTNAVRLMSIHQSKGLEFPVVAVACLGASFNLQDLREDILLHRELGLCAKVISAQTDQRYPSIDWWLARRRERRELLGEELRLLYVAFTRARDTLVLTAFDKGKDGIARWPEREGITERELAGANSFWSWLKLWLGTVTPAENWLDDSQGGNALLTWRRMAENDSWFAQPAPSAGGGNTEWGGAGSIDLDRLRSRLTWQYGHLAATQEPAKSNVSVLRRRASEEDAEARPLFRPRRTRRRDGLSAAAIGIAHHTFQQLVRRERTGSLIELRSEAERLAAEGALGAEAVGELDFNSLLSFWTSSLGRRVRESEHVERELPFTARFNMEELRALGLGAGVLDEGEFVVVQGVVDLLIAEHGEFTLIDFKTDRVTDETVAARAAEYAIQLHLYAAALERTLGRPVREKWLHFFATGQTVAISHLA